MAGMSSGGLCLGLDRPLVVKANAGPSNSAKDPSRNAGAVGKVRPFSGARTEKQTLGNGRRYKSLGWRTPRETPRVSSKWRTPSAPSERADCLKLYEAGLFLARRRKYDNARRLFAMCGEKYPTFEGAWVSLAQMLKNIDWAESEKVLQHGLRQNPKSSHIMQAWALLLLQKNNTRTDLMAYDLLETAVKYDPSNSGVLRWKRVKEIGKRRIILRQRKRQHARARALRAKSKSDVANEGK